MEILRYMDILRCLFKRKVYTWNTFLQDLEDTYKCTCTLTITLQLSQIAALNMLKSITSDY